MVPADPAILFQRAERAFVAGHLDAARADLLAALRLAGEHPAILHLLALVEKRAGRTAAADDAFQRALRANPDDPQIRNNYANLLIASGALDAALVQLDRALARAPGFVDGRINRAIALQKLGRAADAHADCAPIAATRPADARVQTLLGVIERDLDRLDAAAAAFDRALAAEPARMTALIGRARVALERGDADAEARYDAVLAQRPDDADLRLGKAMAAEAMGNAAAATALLEQSLERTPFWTEGQAHLARMRGEAGTEGDLLERFRAAAERADAPLAFTRGYLLALSQAERPAAIVAHLAGREDAVRADPVVAVLHAGALSDTGAAAADAAVERIAGLPGGDVIAARHWLRRGEPDRVVMLLEAAVSAGSGGIAAWAYLGLAWRAVRDPGAEWLYAQPGLHRTFDLHFEPGEREALADLLRNLHRARAHPIGQSLRGGTQTRGNLLARQEPLLRRLRTKLDAAVTEHLRALPSADPRHPLLRHRDAAMRISGSWSVRLSGSGFHVHHIHPDGLLSSALYVALPDWRSEADPHAGWLELGRPPADLAMTMAPIASVEPVPGRLALFPSYLFHGTRPFASGERLTVAFDVRTA